MARVKVLHALLRNSRRTTIEHAVCFARHSYGNEVKFANAFGPQCKEQFDILIVTYDLLALRNTPYWPALKRIILEQSTLCSKVVFFPQDDYSSCALLDKLFASTPNSVVYSPIVNDLQVLYPKSLKLGIRFNEALTGYVDEKLDLIASKYSRPFRSRTIDVGQRVRYLPPQFGKEAQTKGRIAVEFALLASEVGFLCDVSTDATQVFLGEKWHEFLGDTKFTVGGLGGASLADPHGRLSDRVRRKTFKNPEMSMDEINKSFSKRGGRKGDFGAISPRIFEAAALGVCQILFEANYVGRLTPWKHYIPLRSDLANAVEVLAVMKDTHRCSEIAHNCQNELIRTGDFTYDKFVQEFWKRELDVADLTLRKISFSDSIGDMSSLFSKGVERQELCAKQVRLKLMKKRGNRFIPSCGLQETEEFSREEIESLGAWLQGIQDGNIPIESLLINWTPILGSGWLEESLELWG
jgi:hypothetical protein